MRAGQEKDLKGTDYGKRWNEMDLSAWLCAYQTRVAGFKLPQVKPKNLYMDELLVRDTLKDRETPIIMIPMRQIVIINIYRPILRTNPMIDQVL